MRKRTILKTTKARDELRVDLLRLWNIEYCWRVKKLDVTVYLTACAARWSFGEINDTL